MNGHSGGNEDLGIPSAGTRAWKLWKGRRPRPSTISEWFGPTASGKTQACYHKAFHCLSSDPGLFVLWIDTSNAFSARRFETLYSTWLAQSTCCSDSTTATPTYVEGVIQNSKHELNPKSFLKGDRPSLESILRRIRLITCHDAYDFLDALHHVQAFQFHLLIVDSISAVMSPLLGTPAYFPVCNGVMMCLHYLTVTKQLTTILVNTSVALSHSSNQLPFSTQSIGQKDRIFSHAYKPALGKHWARFPMVRQFFSRGKVDRSDVGFESFDEEERIVWFSVQQLATRLEMDPTGCWHSASPTLEVGPGFDA